MAGVSPRELALWAALTLRLCRPHSALLESLINPLQERIEDWKKAANQLDKDHAKGGSQAGPQGLSHCPDPIGTPL